MQNFAIENVFFIIENETNAKRRRRRRRRNRLVSIQIQPIKTSRSYSTRLQCLEYDIYTKTSDHVASLIKVKKGAFIFTCLSLLFSALHFRSFSCVYSFHFVVFLQMSLLNPVRRHLPSIVLRASSSSSSHSRSQKSPYIFPGQNSSIRGDGAIRRTDPIGSTIEQVYSGVLSFVRRNYTRNLKNVDVAVTGIPLDLTTTYRPGARFGPKGIREASVQFAELKSFPGGIDLFEDLAVVDYGDCYFDPSRPASIPLAIEHHAKKIIDRNVFLLSLGTFSFFWMFFFFVTMTFVYQF